jgi:serine phosphatase RsbU (regulator of sigma subunit)
VKRLLTEFAELFDLDYRIRGARLGQLIEQAVIDLDEHARPEWGAPGPAHELASDSDRFVKFYYVPHLFPGMEQKLRLAHKLQFHMLPREVPPNAPVSVAAVLESYCHLSGDLFGWEALADGKFLIWIVDLSGHGVQAGLASAILKFIIDNLRERARVSSLVAELNAALNRCARSESLFATGFFLVIGKDGTACYSSAGHPAVLIRGRDGCVRELRSNSGPVGLFPGQRYVAEPTRFSPGDTLLLYTDGLVEAVDAQGREFGIDRVRRVLLDGPDEPEGITGALYQAVAAHQDMAKLDDDITFLAARVL